MTTLVIMRAKGDIARIQEMAGQSPNPFAHLRDLALSQGGVLRHRIFHVDGEILVIDEWESAEAFQRWMQTPELQRILGELADTQPEITFAEELDVGDRIG